jgi:hypothetical protein
MATDAVYTLSEPLKRLVCLIVFFWIDASRVLVSLGHDRTVQQINALHCQKNSFADKTGEYMTI